MAESPPNSPNWTNGRQEHQILTTSLNTHIYIQESFHYLLDLPDQPTNHEVPEKQCICFYEYSTQWCFAGARKANGWHFLTAATYQAHMPGPKPLHNTGAAHPAKPGTVNNHYKDAANVNTTNAWQSCAVAAECFTKELILKFQHNPIRKIEVKI